jgi:hypothetical protein
MARATVTTEHEPRRRGGRLRHFLRRRGHPLTGLEAFNLMELKRGGDPTRWQSRRGVWPEDRSS